MRLLRAKGVAVVLVCIALVACTDDEPTARKAACKVVLGTMGDLTPETGTGIDKFRGVELAIEEARSRGRLDCDIELQIEDTQGDPELARDHARSMVKNDDLLACLCGYTDEEALAAAPAMSGAGILIT
ncbi:MAG TPA: ABC transporter substrate-binding protein, partial [Actinomycetota bacterium]|nr:ABC transporter substrate-binding protein [Actinomycetota bacterium]